MTSNYGDDYIGSESCNIDLRNDIFHHHCELSKINTVLASKSSSKRREKRELPPPIPHMDIVLRRHYTSDGRLILKEEKVKHHEFFRTHRANGRLTMHLVPLHHQAKASKEEAAVAAAAPTPLQISTDPNGIIQLG